MATTKAAANKKPPTKSEIFRQLAEENDLTRKQVQGVFDSLAHMIQRNLKKNGPGQFTIPGLCKVVVKRMPATPARKGIDPFTKEEKIFKAKPARNAVRVRPLKGLKDMV